ncbi:MAG TPA: hypothetical protein VJX10_04555, partial [Pseudonocardiaceae bacterium]|nr:hypothetical protein [Pseudonocardiaceae bacterium]
MLVTVIGKSTGPWPGVIVTPPSGPDAVSTGWPGAGGGGAGAVVVGAGGVVPGAGGGTAGVVPGALGG